MFDVKCYWTVTFSRYDRSWLTCICLAIRPWRLVTDRLYMFIFANKIQRDLVLGIAVVQSFSSTLWQLWQAMGVANCKRNGKNINPQILPCINLINLICCAKKHYKFGLKCRFIDSAPTKFESRYLEAIAASQFYSGNSSSTRIGKFLRPWTGKQPSSYKTRSRHIFGEPMLWGKLSGQESKNVRICFLLRNAGQPICFSKQASYCLAIEGRKHSEYYKSVFRPLQLTDKLKELCLK